MTAPDLDLAELRRLEAAATKGVWFTVSDLPAIAIGAGDKGYRVVQTANQNNYGRYGTSQRWLGIESEANAALIASLRNAAPALLTAAEENAALKVQNSKLQGLVGIVDAHGAEKRALVAEAKTAALKARVGELEAQRDFDLDADAANRRAEAAEARAKLLADALRPFAKIKPSTFQAPDGTDGDWYRSFLEFTEKDRDFSGTDLAAARAALQQYEEGAK